MPRTILAILFVGLTAPAAPAYIAVPANRLTLPEVMLEFPTVLLLELEKVDDATGAARFTVKEVLQGEKPDSVKVALLDGNKIAGRLRGMRPGTKVVAFLGSVDNRSLLLAPGGWFITKPDQGWERFTQFRDDFQALFAGFPDDLAREVRTLVRGGMATVPVQPGGLKKEERLFVRYEANFPHRRWPSLPPAGSPPAPKGSVAERQRAMIAEKDEAALRAGLKDPHPEVRLAAVVAMGQRATWEKDSTPAVVAKLTDEDRFVCGMAAWALARMNAREALPDLLKAFADRDYNHDFRPHRAAEAAEAVLKLAPGTKDADRAVQFFLGERMLRDQRVDSEGTRTAAARALGRSGAAAKAALPELTKALKDPVPATRIAAAEAIVLIGGNAAAAAKLIEAEIGTGTVASRIQSIRAAAATKLQSARPLIEKATTDPDPDIQREAKIALLKKK